MTNPNFLETPEGDIVPNYSPGHGNQPAYSGKDTEQPDFFHSEIQHDEPTDATPAVNYAEEPKESTTPPAICGDCGIAGGCAHMGISKSGKGYTKGY